MRAGLVIRCSSREPAVLLLGVEVGEHAVGEDEIEPAGGSRVGGTTAARAEVAEWEVRPAATRSRRRRRPRRAAPPRRQRTQVAQEAPGAAAEVEHVGEVVEARTDQRERPLERRELDPGIGVEALSDVVGVGGANGRVTRSMSSSGGSGGRSSGSSRAIEGGDLTAPCRAVGSVASSLVRRHICSAPDRPRCCSPASGWRRRAMPRPRPRRRAVADRRHRAASTSSSRRRHRRRRSAVRSRAASPTVARRAPHRPAPADRAAGRRPARRDDAGREGRPDDARRPRRHHAGRGHTVGHRRRAERRRQRRRRPTTPATWRRWSTATSEAALATRLGIPMLYGVDAVHGNATVHGATVFPHNIGLGAADDPELVERIGRATAVETGRRTGIRWNFAPVVAVPHDIRWGRTYEGYSEDTGIVADARRRRTSAGCSDDGGAPLAAAGRRPRRRRSTTSATAGRVWGTSTSAGTSSSTRATPASTRPSCGAATSRRTRPRSTPARARSWSSFSSWNGTKMHANRYLLTDVLKGELGFDGFVVSDWAGIDQIPGDYASDIVTAINAGIDMVMVPNDYVDVHRRRSPRRSRPAPCREAASTTPCAASCGSSSRPGSSSGRSRPARWPARSARRATARWPARPCSRRSSCSRTTGATLPLDPATPLVLVAGARRRRHRAAERRLDDHRPGRAPARSRRARRSSTASGGRRPGDAGASSTRPASSTTWPTATGSRRAPTSPSSCSPSSRTPRVPATAPTCALPADDRELLARVRPLARPARRRAAVAAARSS